MTRNEIALQVAANTGVAVELVKGEGYWYFTATWKDATGKVVGYDSHSVYVVRLNWMSDEQWIEEGRAFVASFVADLKERGEYK